MQRSLRDSLRPRGLCSIIAIAVALVFCCQPAPAAQEQEQPDSAQIEQEPGQQEATEPVVSIERRSLATLAALRDSRASKLRELQELRDKFEPGLGGESRLQHLEALQKVQLEIDKIDYDFESVAAGIDVGIFDSGVEESFDFITEVEGLLQPIVSELRSATETPREIERLRGDLEYAEKQQLLARAAQEHLDLLIDLVEQAELDEALLAALQESRSAWSERLSDLENQRTVARFQLEQRLGQQTSVLDSAETALTEFFHTRGLNLLFALSAFFAIWFGLRATYRGVSVLVQRHRPGGERKFYARVIDVLYFGFSGLAALGGALLVLYTAGDWAVLGLMLLLLMGVAWAGKTALPRFLEQIWLLLNLGTVREGERVIFNGLPWRVARLSLGVTLVNPELAGGRLRLPLRDMTGLRSRPTAPHEAWFPTQQADWILLTGDRLAQVEFQSAEIVRLEMEGGGQVTYPTTDFQAIAFEKLSPGFRIQQSFGIDYEHQAECTRVVPELMRARLTEALHDLLDPELLRELQVEFQEAAASSLDYAVLADFTAAAAPRYTHLKRALQRMLVDVCNEQGWTIPFTQITVHNG